MSTSVNLDKRRSQYLQDNNLQRILSQLNFGEYDKRLYDVSHMLSKSARHAFFIQLEYTLSIRGCM